MKKCSGRFEVKLAPLDAYAKGRDGLKLGRMSIDKEFSGALSAKSQGEMLTAMTPTQGSAGYVAIEQVCGSLEGHEGSFALQHSGVMHAGTEGLVLEVVPASGSGALEGLRGSMAIRIEDGQHFYDFEYSL